MQRADGKVDAGPEQTETLAGGTEGVDTSRLELREAQEGEIGRLRQDVEAVRISGADFMLHVGTRVYGQSVADYARGAALDYQVAKKHRQRADAIIPRFQMEAEQPNVV